MTHHEGPPEAPQRRCQLCRDRSATLLLRNPRAAAYIAVCGPCGLTATDQDKEIHDSPINSYRLDVLQKTGGGPGADRHLHLGGGGDRHGGRGGHPVEPHYWLCVCPGPGAVRILDSDEHPLGCSCTELGPVSGVAGV